MLTKFNAKKHYNRFSTFLTPYLLSEVRTCLKTSNFSSNLTSNFNKDNSPPELIIKERRLSMGVSNSQLKTPPSVLGWSALSHYKPQHIRKKVLIRDKFTCQYCGSDCQLYVGHKVPRCRGGDDSIRNLEAICKDCSRKKGKLTRKEFLEENLIDSMNFNILPRKDIFKEENVKIKVIFDDGREEIGTTNRMPSENDTGFYFRKEGNGRARWLSTRFIREIVPLEGVKYD